MITYSIIKKSQLEGAHRLDADYYQPEYLELQRRLLSTKTYKLWKDLEGKFITGPFGSEFNVENYEPDGKYRYVRGKDVKEFFLQNDDNVYIPEKDFERLKKYALQDGDILTSVVGTPGITAIVDKEKIPAIFSCKSTAFRSDDINPFYFIAYLNSKFGYKLLERSVRGALQTGLNIGDLESLPVFIPSDKVQEEVAKLVKESKTELENSKSLYSQAEQVLLEELGLQDFSVEDGLWSVVKLSEVKNAERMDGQYFEPRYHILEEKLKKYGVKLFTEIIQEVPAKFDPKSKADQTFNYVELSNINASIGVIEGSSEVLGKEAPSRARRVLKTGDVIVSSVEGSLGKVALVDTSQDGYLASTGFFQFRSREILPEALLMLAKSIVFNWQLQQRTAGTILTAVPGESLKSVLVPVLPKPTQQKIADLVRASHAARKKAKELLEEAKRTVERLIEGRES